MAPWLPEARYNKGCIHRLADPKGVRKYCDCTLWAKFDIYDCLVFTAVNLTDACPVSQKA